ncbi:MAG: FprA family A-type flavoprotein [Erysipelotrichaceae bacterium]|nr:FprA family A-type flavoprotein [Erysipelotrichaceae bacterium]
MIITNDIKYVGVNDHRVDLFEGQYVVTKGMTYNSYVIDDEKTVVIDTADVNFTEEWLNNVETVLAGRKPDYLLVQHMEPDHSASIVSFMNKYTETTILASAMAFTMMKNFYGFDYSDRRIVIKEGDSLDLGKHKLSFISAPMVHWPEVMVTYDATDKVLFSADGFGKFGALDVEETNWKDEARRYYIGIVGKYGLQVQALLKKASALDIQTICPLHGPVLKEDLGYYIGLYDTWSSYRPEEEGVLIAYTSIYGNTKKAVELLAEELKAKGETVEVIDLARCDMAYAVSEAFKFDRLVLATTTYNTEIYPSMHTYIHKLTERLFQNRKVGLIENGSWAPTAAAVMKKLLEGSKNLTFTDTTVKINSGLNETSIAQVKALAEELAK